VSKPSPGSSSASARAVPSATKPRGSSKKETQVSAPETPGPARIVAIANQKGGVGKSTTAVSLGAALAEIGFRILVVDLDPQGNASTGMGIRHEHRQVSTYDVIVAESPVADAIVHSPIEGLDAIPSTIDLAGAEIELVSQFSREGRLKRALEPVRGATYDFIFLDCPPSLGLITINALTAAEELIVPIQCEYYALEGLGQLLRNVSLVQQNINPELRLTGIVMTMFDPRTKLSQQVVDEVRRFFGDVVYDSIIPRTVRLSEAPGFGVPITVYDPRSKGAASYRSLAQEVAARPPPDSPMPTFDDMPAIVVPSLSHDPSSSEEEGTEESEEPAIDAGPVAESPLPPDPVPPEPTTAVPQEPPVAAPEPAVAASPPDARSEPEPPPEPVARASAPQEPAREVAARPKPTPPSEEEIWEPAEPERGRVRPIANAVPGELPERRVVVIDEDADLGAAGVDRPGAPANRERPGEDIGATLHDDDGQKRRWRLFRKGGE
jgi:chromosome partitioning protein